MRSKGKVLSSINHVKGIIKDLEEKCLINEKLIEVFRNWLAFRKENRTFELCRSRFYGDLSQNKPVESKASKEEVIEFWTTMWNKRKFEEGDKPNYELYLDRHYIEETAEKTFLNFEEFTDVIKLLPYWKLIGSVAVYNFFIRELTFSFSLI